MVKLATLLLSAALCWGQSLVVVGRGYATSHAFAHGPEVPCPSMEQSELFVCYQRLPANVPSKLAALLIKYEHHPSGGLRYVGQRGAHRDAAGYARWATAELSRAGLERDLARKFARGETVAQIVNGWAGRGTRVPYADRLLKEMK